MKKVDTRRIQVAEMRMMYRKTLCDGIPNGLLKDRSGEYRESCKRDQTEMAWTPLKNG